MKVKVLLRAGVVRDRLIRKSRSQNWLAVRLGITPGYISQIMDGCRNPSPALRQRFLDTFPECEFDDLFQIVKRKKS